MNNSKSWVEVEGFKKWDPFFDFVKDKYSDVSVALMHKDFETGKRAMRELIDNTSPYHNRTINVKVKEEEKPMDYAEYFEFCVNDYEEALQKENSKYATPDERTEVLHKKDNFYTQIRLIRRLIMQDLSRSGIIPTTEEKKEREVNPALKGE